MFEIGPPPQGENRAPLTKCRAGRDGNQESNFGHSISLSKDDIQRPQKDMFISQTRTSVFPPSFALSAHTDQWQWDEIFPETIMCTLRLYQAAKRKADQAHSSKLLRSDGPAPIRWYKHDAYDSLGRKQQECERESFRDVGTKDLYIRHGICRIVGKKHEAWQEMDGFSDLKQTAITLICGFIHDHDHEIFSMEVSWEYATMQIKPRPPEAFARTIQKELCSKILQNYQGKEYIPQADLIKIMNSNVIRMIIEDDEDVKRESWTEEQRKDFHRVVLRRASRLQAICVKQNLTMGFLAHLLQNKFDDRHSPTDEWFERHNCSDDECYTSWRMFLSAYYAFIPHKFDKRYEFQEFSLHEVIPLYNSETGSEKLGYGSASTVCKVNIDPVQHSLTTVCLLLVPVLVSRTNLLMKDRRCAFALKKFHERKCTVDSFKREQAMIEKLALRPHEHITPYLAMWTQSGISYILFPLAKCNLREFMASTLDRPHLSAPIVLWFLDQLKGLACAVKHIHFIGEGSSPDDSAVTISGDYHLLGADLDETQNRLGLAGFHHDIKSENILVFEKETTQPGTGGIFKITDFGSGRFADLGTQQQSSGVPAAKGTITYEAPDPYPSRPFDIWCLGCVFIELLIWALTPEQDGGEAFSSRRGWMADQPPGMNEPTYDVDKFWYQDPSSKETKLKHAVQMQLDELQQKYSRGRTAFKRVTQLVQELLTIDPLLRPKAAQVVARLTDILENARVELERDPSCYLEDSHRRSASPSAPKVSVMEVPRVDSVWVNNSAAVICEAFTARKVLHHTYDSEGSPNPFLHKGEEALPAESLHVNGSGFTPRS
jgi:serine/threonine protein kinase